MIWERKTSTKRKYRRSKNIDRIEQNAEERKQQEIKLKEAKRKKRIKRHSRRVSHLSVINLSDSDSDSDDEYDIDELLTKFPKIANMGQLFYRHSGRRRQRKPQDRVVTVSFDKHGRPSKIRWGSGSRYIEFKDILYVSWGHSTPVLIARAHLNAKRCLSVVAQTGIILDLEAYNEHTAELWVKGLRRLLGHTDKKSDELAQDNKDNLVQNVEEKKKTDRDRRHDTIIDLQKDLFVMTCHTVFRHLTEERIWNVTDETREMFSPQKMYPIALKADIPWRQWQNWIREKVTTHLREEAQRRLQQQVHGQAQPEDQCLVM